LVESLFNENYLKADATTNITNKTDIYLDKDAQKNTVNLFTHEDAHQAEFFVLGVTARVATDLLEIHHNSAALFLYYSS
jgi:hypothetical protein